MTEEWVVVVVVVSSSLYYHYYVLPPQMRHQGCAVAEVKRISDPPDVPWVENVSWVALCVDEKLVVVTEEKRIYFY